MNGWDDNDTIWLYKSTGHTTKTEEDEGRYEEGKWLMHIHYCSIWYPLYTMVIYSITIIIMRVMIILMRSFLVINHDPHFS